MDRRAGAQLAPQPLTLAASEHEFVLTRDGVQVPRRAEVCGSDS